MTLGANHAGMRAHQGENAAVIECGRLPRRGGMAFLADGAFAASMNILGCMASYAGRRGAFEITVGVALCALHTDVRPGQLKGELVVIKVGNLPGRGVVTGTASRAEGALMSVIFLVAADTGHRCVLELEGCCVAACAKQGGMLAFKFENIEVIESGGLPGRGIVAAFAGCAFGTGMLIILLMTACAGHGCTLEYAIDMALPTLDGNVRTSQFESRQIMVKAGRLPCGCIVTGAAGGAQSAFMGIIFLVAAKTSSGRILELEGCCVAASAKQGGMLAIQHKNIEVIKSGWLPGSGSMAGLASGTLCTSVLIIFLMTAYAGHGCAFEFAIYMTLCALNINVRAIQFEGSQIMIKAGRLPGSGIVTGTAGCT
jgi:hypothetical protein